MWLSMIERMPSSSAYTILDLRSKGFRTLSETVECDASDVANLADLDNVATPPQIPIYLYGQGLQTECEELPL